MTICLLLNSVKYKKVYSFQVFNVSEKFSYINTPMLFHLDYFNLTFISLTVVIAMYVLPFVFRYMKHEPEIWRFYLLLNGFIASMILLLASNTWWAILLGWELIGWFSYFLINFFNPNKSVFKSSNKALIFNKLSDVGIYLFIISSLTLPISGAAEYAGFWDFLNSTMVNDKVSIKLVYLMLVGLLICAFCKSAQFGFYFWLPDSMEAPVPASALIHSATLVSAGLYLIGRCQKVISFYSVFFYIVMIIGLVTAVIGAIVACYQTDLKKTLAYSTISHCGVLMFLLTAPNLHYFLIYLVIHGIFKSFSFIIAGDLIIFNHGYQDFRKLGGLIFKKKFLLGLFLFSLSGLSSLPFTIGFFSKYYFLNHGVLYSPQTSALFLFLLLIVGVASLVYFFRLIYYCFFGKTNSFILTLLRNEVKKNYIIVPKQYFGSYELVYIFFLILIAGYLALYLQIFMVFSNKYSGDSIDLLVEGWWIQIYSELIKPYIQNYIFIFLFIILYIIMISWVLLYTKNPYISFILFYLLLFLIFVGMVFYIFF